MSMMNLLTGVCLSRPWRLALSAIALAFAVASGAARADTIIMDDGQKYIGHIVEKDAQGVIVERGVTTFELRWKRIKHAVQYTHRDTSLVQVGDSFVEEQDYEMARHYYKRALNETQHKDVVNKRLQIIDELIFRKKELAPAEEAFRNGDYRLAADLYQALLAGKPKGPLALLIRNKAVEASCALAQQGLEAQRYDDAWFDLGRAAGLDSFSARVHALAGHLLQRQGKYLTAYEEFAMALEMDSGETLAMKGLELLGRDVDEFMSKLNAAGKRGPVDPEEARSLSRLFSEGTFQGSQEGIDYSALNRKNPYLANVNFNLQMVNQSQAKAAKGSSLSPAQFSTGRKLSIFLQAYNAGPNITAFYGGRVPYKETVNYVKRVNDALLAIRDGTMKSTPYDGLIQKYALNFNLSPNLIKAIVKVESDFNPKCVSRANARGLIQLVPVDWNDTMKRIGKNLDFDDHVHNPDWNLYVGCHYLRWLYDTCLPKLFRQEFS